MNDLRAIRYKVFYGTDGKGTFYRTNSGHSYVPRSWSKPRFLRIVRKYVDQGYRIVPNHSGWTLIVKT